MDTTKYSLWLTPEEPGLKLIQAAIDELALKYNNPNFTAHATLIGNLPIPPEELASTKMRISQAVANTTSFSTVATEVRMLSEEHRCVFLALESAELTTLYAHFSEYFPQIENEKFISLPHISLMYGKYSEQQKESEINAIDFTPMNLTFRSVDLHATEGPVEEWTLVERFPLK